MKKISLKLKQPLVWLGFAKTSICTFFFAGPDRTSSVSRIEQREDCKVAVSAIALLKRPVFQPAR